MAKGGFTGAVPSRETSPEEYSGVWDVTEQYSEQKTGSWPFQEDDCAPKSLLFDGSSGHLSRTLTASSNRRVWTMSMWVKRSKLGTLQDLFSAGQQATNDGKYARFQFMDDDTFRLRFWTEGGSLDANLQTVRVFRDCTAFYHFVIRHDSTESNQEDRLRIYVNGDLITEYSTPDYLSQNVDGHWNFANKTQMIGAHYDGGGSETDAYFDGYISEVHHIDGQSLPPEEFAFEDGQGIWQPKRFTGDYSSGPVYSNSTDSSLTFAEGPAGMFDGSLTTRGGASTTNQAYVTLFDNISIPCETGIRIYWNGVSSGQRYIRINGTTVLDDGSSALTPGWSTVSSFSGTINKLEVQTAASGSWSLSAIEVDNQILTDASVGRNSFHLDFSDGAKDQSGLANDWTANGINTTNLSVAGRTWSGLDTWPTASYSTDPDHAFNGTYGSANTADMWYSSGASTVTLTNLASALGTGVTNVTVRVYDRYGDVTLTVNSNSATTSTNNAYQDISLDHDGSAITTLTVQGTDTSYWGINAFKINGVELVDGSGILSGAIIDSPVDGNEASTNAGGERRANYCTWNPVDQKNATLSSGGLVCSLPANASNYTRGTISVTSGKWYWEVALNSGVHGMIGISQQDYPGAISYTQGVLFYYVSNGNIYGNVGRSGTYSSYGNGLSVGDVLGIALDMDNGNVKFYKNGTAEASGANANSSTLRGLTISPCLGEGGGAMTTTTNFGQRSFSHTPPTGYSPLATSFLSESTIKRGDEGMAVATYTGNSTAHTIDNLRISPDLVWIKNRSTNPSTGHYWHMHDTVRGKSNGFYRNLYSNGNEAEDVYPGSSYGGVVDITKDGFVLGTAGGYSPAHLNNAGTTYAAFCWDAGETTTTISVGGLNSSVYDQSQSWSSYGDTNDKAAEAWEDIFDGNGVATPHMVANSGATAVWTPTTAISFTKLELYANNDGYGDITLNGSISTTGVIPAGGGANIGWADVTHLFTTKSLSSIEVPNSYNTDPTRLGAIRIDGKILADFNITVTNVPSIATTVRARPETGFSIATYTGNSTGGATVAHGFSKEPDFFMIGCRNVTNGNYWDVWHSAYYQAGSSNYMRMSNNSTNGAKYAADMFQTPTTFVNTLGSSSSQNGTNNYVMYSWTAVEGYSAFGEFTGLGSESTGDGPYVYCGFKPAVILWKAHSLDGGNWFMVDTSRHPDNVNDAVLRPNTNGEETDHDYIDVLSNGFKVRATPSLGGAGSGYKFLYAAWAENPFSSQTRAN